MLRKLLSLLSDAVIYGASSLLGQFISFLLLPIYLEYIDRTDNGIYVMITNVVMFYGPLTNLGMTNAVFRRFNLEKNPAQRGEVLSTGLWSILLASLGMLALGLTFAHLLARIAVGEEVISNDPNVVEFVRLGLFTVAANGLGAVPLAVLRADRRVKTTALVNISRVLLTVTCTIWLVVFREQGVRGVFLGTLFGELATTLLLFAITLRAFRFRPTVAAWKRMSSYGLPFVPHQIQGRLMEIIPPYAIGHIAGLADLGLYGIALKFAMPLVFVVNSVHNAWVPYKFQIHAEDEDPVAFFRTAVTYYVAGILYLWVGVSLWGPELLWLMARDTPEYHPAGMLVPFVALIPVSQGIYFMMGTGMELSDDTRPFPLVTLAGLVTVAASVQILVPIFGAAGGAIAAVNSFIALGVVLYYFSQKRFPIRYDWPTVIALAVLACIAVGIGYLGLQQPALVRIPTTLAISLVFPAIEFAVLLRSPTERHRMRILWEKLSRRRHRAAAIVAVDDTPAVSQAQ